jgi:regulation of enolase protein 1 (concanavalin A-like superfamily)
MIRESLDANAANFLLNLNPGGGVEALARTSAGASTSFLAGSTATMPVWLRIVRVGTMMTASVSPDGTSWTTVAIVSVPMASNVYVGLAVCSHNTSRLNTATFDNVNFRRAAASGVRLQPVVVRLRRQ